MAIDGCAHDFEALAVTVLPAHMRALMAALERPLQLRDFSDAGVGVRALLKRHGHAAEFSGCYVLVDKQPIYVGISRGVFGRLRQHVTGRSHFDASLAYRMAEKMAPHGKTRSDAMKDPVFRLTFEERRSYLRSLRAAAVPIENPVELYLFEVFAAMALNTPEWNTFRTH